MICLYIKCIAFYDEYDKFEIFLRYNLNSLDKKNCKLQYTYEVLLNV